MKSALLAAVLIIAPSIALAQHVETNDHAGMDHATHAVSAQNESQVAPTEPGQAALAAMAEIVEILNADPETDWDKVDIDALREHLVDMKNLTEGAQVVASTSGNQITFFVSGEGLVKRAIQNMVPAHAAELKASLGWSTAAELTVEGATLTVTTSPELEIVKLVGLGFFGIMATGAHHQAHHLMIARGEGAHS